jgi:GNAT superfamily N-acetyltransferase
MDTVIREAAIGDAARIAEIHVATWRHTYRGIVSGTLLSSLSVEQRTKDWRTRLQPSARNTYVIELEGVIVGWASIGPARDEGHKGTAAELYAIYMAPSHMGQKLGQVLYARCEQVLERDKYPLVLVWVLEANTGARRFYEKMGFMPDGATKLVPIGGADLPELRYSKRLPAS